MGRHLRGSVLLGNLLCKPFQSTSLTVGYAPKLYRNSRVNCNCQIPVDDYLKTSMTSQLTVKGYSIGSSRKIRSLHMCDLERSAFPQTAFSAAVGERSVVEEFASAKTDNLLLVRFLRSATACATGIIVT